tara:strand:- start:1424 stop:1777 length:354 start_codon:yes stop_codon:yes gene_type:complete
MAVPAKQVLETALNLIGGDRATDYGSMWENHENIARLWNGYLYNKEGDLTAEDVANMMELMKIARRKLGTLKKDNYIDGAGYAAVAFECALEESAQNTKSDQFSLELVARKYNEKKS